MIRGIVVGLLIAAGVAGQRSYPGTGRGMFRGGAQSRLPGAPAYPGYPSPFPGAFDRSRYYGQGGTPPTVPGIGGGLPTIPLRTPVRVDQKLLPFLGGRLPQGQGGKPGELSRWPSWMQIGGPGHRVLAAMEDATPKPSHCFLVRFTDAVEVRPAAEQAFYPLAFWDSSRVLEPGAAVRLSGQGSAQLVFSDGSRVDLSGDSELVFVQGTKQRLALDCRRLARAEFRLGLRRVEVTLPDGSLARGSQLSFGVRRDRAPAAWLHADVEDRLTVVNWGPEELAIDSSGAIGISEVPAVTLKPNRRSTVVVVPRGAAAAGASNGAGRLAQSLSGGGVDLRATVRAEIAKLGGSLRVDSRGGPATLQWGGFRCRLPGGRRLVIDPLLGSPFGQGRPVSTEAEPRASDQPSPGKESGR